jgi:A/G-specific adenine glycosylase
MPAAAAPPDDLAADLLAWYDAGHRALPWRDAGAAPYRTLVSEFMCQQTRVEAVLPYFARWMESFPTVEALAAAPEDAVLERWAGLGYYARARNLHATARAIAQDGFPQTVEGLRALPGVGPYIAAAVGSIAFGARAAAVDGNLERVFARVFGHPGGRAALTPRIDACVPAGRPGDFNQAAMDLGATVCTPRAPRCAVCPLEARCAAAAAGTPTAYPAPKAKKSAPERWSLALVVADGAGRVLLRRRPSRGLYAGLYELPTTDPAPAAPDDVAATAQAFAAALGWGALESVGALGPAVAHTLTHMRLTVVPVVVRPGAGLVADGPGLLWAHPAAPGAVALSTLGRKVLSAIATPQRQMGLFGDDSDC